ncbi:MAG: HAD family phosphatase, partial [Actinomycetota bacterium]|nr:HAD family phosphatase [Actinomycetota bacterium]
MAGPDPCQPRDARAAAFFDVDNTVLQGASIYHLARGLYDRGLITRRAIMRFGVQQARFRVAGTEHVGHIDGAREAALAFIKGRSVPELAAIGEEVFDQVLAAKLWPGTCELAQRHLDAGERVWLVTATPIEMARVIAARLGLTGALGTVAETVDGVYTGRLVGGVLHGAAKAQAVLALAEAEGLDLTRCSSYSDSANDIPLLSLTGHACAVNPDARLRAHARAHGWPVRDYRT